MQFDVNAVEIQIINHSSKFQLPTKDSSCFWPESASRCQNLHTAPQQHKTDGNVLPSFLTFYEFPSLTQIEDQYTDLHAHETQESIDTLSFGISLGYAF